MMTSERIRSGRKMRRAKTWRGARTNSSRRMTFAVKGDEISIEMDIGAGGETSAQVRDSDKCGCCNQF